MKKIKMLIAMSALVLGTSAVSEAGTGAVYAMTNALGQNQILVYQRAKNGTLTLTQTIATGGGGSGFQLAGIDSLGSQGSLLLGKGHRRLFAVNTETLASNNGMNPTYDCQEGTITSFLVGDDGSLTFADKVTSGGLYPNSLTLSGDLLYVLNAGGPGLAPSCSGTSPNISGFKVDGSGNMKPLADSLRAIDAGHLYGTGFLLDCDPGGFAPAALFYCGLNPPAFPRSPAKVGFTPAGDQLAVTVKATNTIYVFAVNKNGTLGYPTLTQAQGPNQPTYFGFTFDKAGHMIVTEPFGESPTIPNLAASSLSSFAITKAGELRGISASVANGQALSCWVALDPTGKYAYVSDNGNGKISSYLVGSNGRLKLLAAISAVAGQPNDLAIAAQGDTSFLYSLDAGDGTVGAFQINRDGSLTSLGYFAGLPVNSGAQGIAAY